jgi:hypothetical protein
MDTIRYREAAATRRSALRLPRPWVVAAWMAAAVVLVGMIGG